MKGLIRDILTFLRELQENNDREWFAGQKPRYQKLKEGFDELVDRLIAQTAVWDEEVKNLKAKDCVYRIYRDIRFSPDKRPYKDHFAAYICGGRGRNSGRCGYYPPPTGVLYVGRGVLLSGTGFVETDQAGYL